MEINVTRIGIVGGTGYTGVELLRLLAVHNNCRVDCITSRTEVGNPVATVFPWLSSYSNLRFEEPSVERLADCDLVFYATPNKTAMHEASFLLDRGTRVIDLAADFRFSDLAIWEGIYNGPHGSPELVSEAVYGLPEKNRCAIKNARLVGNPGCYPTATLLGLLPLVELNVIDDCSIIVDGKSGASGAGREMRSDLMIAETADNFRAYAGSGHRHGPEMQHQLSNFGSDAVVTFVPHMVPMIRGIEVTIYVPTDLSVEEARSLYQQRYDADPMITVISSDEIHPETRWVRGSNRCVIGIYQQRSGQLIISSVIDNLVKGAAGQAIQNMNLMLRFDETESLVMDSVSP